MRKLKRYSTIYNSLLLLTVFCMLACGPGLYDDNEFPGYFMPQSAYTPPNSIPYYYSPEFLYVNTDEYWNTEAWYPDSFYKNDENLSEWKNYCHIQVSDSLTADVIYKGKDDKANPFYRALRQKPAAWNYLLVARRIEKASGAGGEIWNPTPADTPAMKQLFQDVTGSIKTINDPFLKDRYAFQAIKLADELSDYDACIHIYDQYFRNKSDSSVIKWWALSRKGGALLYKGDTVLPVYIFAQVFAHCPSRRKAAYMSLRMYHIRFVPAALQYCKDNDEKEAVYTLCALMPWQDALPLMKAMIKINPNASYLELIMTRDINKNESYYYDSQNIAWGNDTTGNYERRQQAGSYFEKLGEFADQCANNSVIKDHTFWNTAAAYIAYIEGNYRTANDYLTKASEEPTNNPVLPQQIQLQKILLLTAEAKHMTPELEREILPMLFDLENSQPSFYKGNALALAGERLAVLYKAVDMASQKTDGLHCYRSQVPSWTKYALAKSWLMTLFTTWGNNPSGEVFTQNNNILGMEDTTSLSILNNLITFFSQPNPSQSDKQMMRLAETGLNNSYFNCPCFGLNYLYFIKGRKALVMFQYNWAEEDLRHVSDSFWDKYPFKIYLVANPFVTPIIDTHTPTKADTIKYTPYQFADRMRQLFANVRNHPSTATSDYYLLGCGAYNMSYYGNSWFLSKPEWSSDELAYGISTPLDITDSINYYTTRVAENYFANAVKSATIKDKELAARACFMAAKCEQNQFYLYIEKDSALSLFLSYAGGYANPNPDESPRLGSTLQNIQNTQFHHYFNILKDKYSATEFNKEVIRECATYRDFVEGK